MSCEESLAVGPYVIGEKPTPLEYQFLDMADVPISLVGFTARFIVRERSVAAAIDRAAVVSDAVNGKVTYTWQGNEFPTSGHYLAEFWVGNGTNRYASQLITFDVRTPVGSVPAI